jgi:N-acetylneuraminic acid mutarotase
MGGLGADSNATAEADVYASGAWQRTGDMQQAVYRPAAIALDDGRVLVVGGETSTDVDNPPAPIQVYWP